MDSLGREPQDSRPQNNHQPRSGDRCPGRRAAAYAAAENLPPLWGFFLFVVVTLGLLTAFGRGDAPSPASGRWPGIPGLGHVSLPPAGSRPRQYICRASGAPFRNRGWRTQC